MMPNYSLMNIDTSFSFGLDNTPVSNEYAPNTWFDPDALQQIRFYQLRANQV